MSEMPLVYHIFNLQKTAIKNKNPNNPKKKKNKRKQNPPPPNATFDRNLKICV